MKFVADRPFADPRAARKLLELANAVEPVQDGRIYIEKINGPFIFSSRERLRNTRPVLSVPLRTAGYGCMRAAPKSAFERGAGLLFSI